MRIATLLALVGVLAAATGCADPELKAKVQELDAKVQTLEEKLAAAPSVTAQRAQPGKAARPEPTAEDKAALGLLQEARQAIQTLDYDTANAKLDEIKAKYSATRAWPQAQRTRSELDVVGKAATDIDIEKWYTSNKGDLKDGKATLLVFFESWCGYCKREVPKLAEKYPDWKNRGLNVIGLTKVTRSATDEKVNEFIETAGVTFPVGKEAGGKASDAFAVQGVPAAAVVKDGKVIWRGHPGSINDAMVDTLLGA